MKKVVLLFVFLFSSLYSFDTLPYEEAISKAKNENKYVIMVMKTRYCPWCKKLINEVLEDMDIKEKIKKDFILSIVDRDKDKYPEKFYSRLVPTTFFIDPNIEEEVDMTIGYVGISKFMKKLDEVSKIKTKN
jgi:thioredoxin-related protein